MVLDDFQDQTPELWFQLGPRTPLHGVWSWDTWKCLGKKMVTEQSSTASENGRGTQHKTTRAALHKCDVPGCLLWWSWHRTGQVGYLSWDTSMSQYQLPTWRGGTGTGHRTALAWWDTLLDMAEKTIDIFCHTPQSALPQRDIAQSHRSEKHLFSLLTQSWSTIDKHLFMYKRQRSKYILPGGGLRYISLASNASWMSHATVRTHGGNKSDKRDMHNRITMSVKTDCCK